MRSRWSNGCTRSTRTSCARRRAWTRPREETRAVARARRGVARWRLARWRRGGRRRASRQRRQSTRPRCL
eukprot:3195878-Pleurochrysis_carterae.AAC.2